MTPIDYSKFGGFFDKVIRDYHGDESEEKKHLSDWGVEGSDYDVKKLGQDEFSMRTSERIPISSLKSSINLWWMSTRLFKDMDADPHLKSAGIQATGRKDVAAGKATTR
ncbi:predicted protein [Thalassiosira pseudonana CCMP1335]|uniref:Phosphagen kinase N-terminal domain-containing protein n=1 Tax=Thalassiosira pseudonana TaxID=35128 RepID=B8CCN6_THAPS|nr:predicted protein [Thalassiosira pseudonana CCMP1335]EED88979.1 predicted protein [Thalassiosira pseudonana CCMP1335]|eukprot:scaffold13556_cov280-Alexandrium_tamarense.AAC.13